MALILWIMALNFDSSVVFRIKVMAFNLDYGLQSLMCTTNRTMAMIIPFVVKIQRLKVPNPILTLFLSFARLKRFITAAEF